MKFLHAADIHLDSPLRGLARYEGAPEEEIRGATRRAFENLVALSLEEAVDFVLLAGDLYDGDWNDYNTGLFLISQVARLQEAGIPVFMVAGNHDAASQITKTLKLPKNVHMFSTDAPETFRDEQLGIAVHGQGFLTRAVKEDLTLRYPATDADLFNIGLLHTSLDGRPGHSPYAPCSVDGLKTLGYQYWALGHVHQREVVSEAPWIVFPGNIQGRHMRETGDKGCSLITVEDGEVSQVEHRSLDVVRWAECRLDVSGVTSLDELLEAGRNEFEILQDSSGGRVLGVRVSITGASPVNAKLRAMPDQVAAEFRALATTVGQGKVWIEKVAVGTSAIQSQEAALNRDDALGSLLRAIADLDVDNGRLTELGADLADLRKKLPPALLSGEEAFDPTDAEVLQQMLPDIKEILVSQLLQQGEPE